MSYYTQYYADPRSNHFQLPSYQIPNNQKIPSNRQSPLPQQTSPIISAVRNEADTLQAKLDYLNHRLDQQLQMSSQLSSQVINRNSLSPYSHQQNSYNNQSNMYKASTANNIYPVNNNLNLGQFSIGAPHFYQNPTPAYTYMGNMGSQIRTGSPIGQRSVSPPMKKTVVRLPGDMDPAMKQKIIEEELKRHRDLSPNNFSYPLQNGQILGKSETPKFIKKNEENNNIKANNMAILDKINLIKESLGVDVEAIVEKMYLLAETHPDQSPNKGNQNSMKAELVQQVADSIKNKGNKSEFEFQTPCRTSIKDKKNTDKKDSLDSLPQEKLEKIKATGIDNRKSIEQSKIEQKKLSFATLEQNKKKKYNK